MSAAAAAALKQSQSMQKEEQERRQRAGALEEETGKRAAAGEIQQPAAKAAELCLKSVTRSSVCPFVRPSRTDGDRRRPSYCCSTSVGRSHARRAYVRVGARAEKITVEIGEDIDCWGLFSPCLPFSVVRGEPVCVAAARFGTLTCFVVSGAAAEAARKPAGGPPTELVG